MLQEWTVVVTVQSFDADLPVPLSSLKLPLHEATTANLFSIVNCFPVCLFLSMAFCTHPYSTPPNSVTIINSSTWDCSRGWVMSGEASVKATGNLGLYGGLG